LTNTIQLDFNRLVFTGRGSTALWAILKSLGKPGRRILIPVNICEIIVPIILQADMIPIYYDVDKNTGISNFDHIVNAKTCNVVALLAVHNFGIPLEIDKISNWARRQNIFLIEDVCNALGAKFNNVNCGLWGDASIFSFGYAKIIEYGVGGAAYVKDPVLREKIINLVSGLDIYSQEHKLNNDLFQAKLRAIRLKNQKSLPGIYVALYKKYIKHLFYKLGDQDIAGITQALLNLSESLKTRNEIAAKYRKGITTNIISQTPETAGQVYWRYNILVDAKIRNGLLKTLRKNKVLVSSWYPPVIGLFNSNYNAKGYPGAVAFSNRVINLFVDYRVSETDIIKTLNIINRY